MSDMTNEQAKERLESLVDNEDLQSMFLRVDIEAMKCAISALSDNKGKSIPETAKPEREYIDKIELVRKLNAWDCKAHGIPNYAWRVINEVPTYSFPDSAKNKDGWIPIEERKPNEYDVVLVSTDIEEVFEATYYGDELGFDDNNGNFYEGEVIAWQPLPESYKAESEEK